MSELKNNGISLRVRCGFCRQVFSKYSKLVFSSLEEVNIGIDCLCRHCKLTTHQSYWIEKGADDELRICIGSRDNVSHPMATISGTITTNGVLDYKKLSWWNEQGLIVIRNN